MGQELQPKSLLFLAPWRANDLGNVFVEALRKIYQPTVATAFTAKAVNAVDASLSPYIMRVWK